MTCHACQQASRLLRIERDVAGCIASVSEVKALFVAHDKARSAEIMEFRDSVMTHLLRIERKIDGKQKTKNPKSGVGSRKAKAKNGNGPRVGARAARRGGRHSNRKA
jgi:hypothetical protein